MAFHAGKSAGIKWAATLASPSSGGTEISAYIDKLSFERMMAFVETTTFGATWGKSVIAGVGDVKISVGGPYDTALESVASFETDVLAGTARYVRIIMDTTAAISATNPVWICKIVASGLKMDSDVGGRWSWASDWQLADGVKPQRDVTGTW